MLKRVSIILIGLILCLGAGWYFLMPTQEADIVVLRSPEGPYRVKPAHTGGKEITHQGSTVMQMIDELDPVQDDVEVVKLPGDEPEMPPVKVEEEQQPIEPASSLPEKLPEQPEQILAVPVNGASSQEDVAAASDVSADNASAQTQETEEAKSTTEQTASIAAPKQRPASPKPVSAPKILTPSSDEVRLFTVQLAAFRDESKAEKAAALLNQKHAERLNGLSLGLLRSDSVNGVTYWRVTTEPVAKADAASICDTLNKAGQDCIVKKYQQ